MSDFVRPGEGMRSERRFQGAKADLISEAHVNASPGPVTVEPGATTKAPGSHSDGGNRTELLDALSEREWQRQVVQLAQQLGWHKTYHTYDSRRSHSGFPDLVLVRDRVIFAELKRQNTHPSADQVEWLNRLANAGAETYLWRPADLNELARILGLHALFIRTELRLPAFLKERGSAKAGWTPGSLWIPGQGRHDGSSQQPLM